MDYKDNIISYVAESECEKISGKVIRELQKMTKEMLSADDSPLKNTWDEICVQVQHDCSTMWDVYLDVVRSLIQFEVDQLNVEIKQAIWFQTEEGCYWDEDEEEDDNSLFSDENTIEYILDSYVLKKGREWTNKRIEKYLERGYRFS